MTRRDTVWLAVVLITAGGCSHLVETRSVNRFTGAFEDRDIAALREATTSEFQQKALRDKTAVEKMGRALARAVPRVEGIEVLGPAPAPLAILRGRHRYRLLLKAPKDVHIQPVLKRWLCQVRTGGGVRIQIDIDPYSFM